MKNRIIASCLISSSFFLANGISNSEFSTTSPEEDGPLKQFKPFGFTLALQGLHAVNSQGWYLTTKAIADRVEAIQKSFIHDPKEYKKSETYNNKVYSVKHDNFDLALVKFERGIGISYGHEQLSHIATPPILETSPWVLSLSKIDCSDDIVIEDKKPIEDVCLAAVSRIKEVDKSYLVLEKGILDNFYIESRKLFKNIFINRLIKPSKTLWEKEKYLKEMKEIEDKTISNRSINWYWKFLNTLPCNGVADEHDLGGGIYSYPTHVILAAPSEVDSKLIGITVPGGLKGETSVALNLTSPGIRGWMLHSMNKYYRENH